MTPKITERPAASRKTRPAKTSPFTVTWKRIPMARRRLLGRHSRAGRIPALLAGVGDPGDRGHHLVRVSELGVFDQLPDVDGVVDVVGGGIELEIAARALEGDRSDRGQEYGRILGVALDRAERVHEHPPGVIAVH